VVKQFRLFLTKKDKVVYIRCALTESNAKAETLVQKSRAETQTFPFSAPAFF
jgi:hypothetical protein